MLRIVLWKPLGSTCTASPLRNAPPTTRPAKPRKSWCSSVIGPHHVLYGEAAVDMVEIADDMDVLHRYISVGP
jgi:hypothetical protein